MQDIQLRIGALERKVDDLKRSRRRLQTIVGGMLLAAAAIGLGALAATPVQDTIVARNIVIVDQDGTPRVLIGAPLPDPPILGRRVPRGDVAHGILLFDATGSERGGYVTFDGSGVAMISVDTSTTMVGRLAAGPIGGGALLLRDEQGHETRVGAYPGGPFVSLRDGERERVITPDEGAGQ